MEKLEKTDYEKETLLGINLYTGYCRVPDRLKYRVMRDDSKKKSGLNPDFCKRFN